MIGPAYPAYGKPFGREYFVFLGLKRQTTHQPRLADKEKRKETTNPTMKLL